MENFKNIPRSPYGGATELKCNFFSFKFATKSLEKKKEGACRPPNGRQAPVAHPSGDQPGGPAYRRQGGRSPILRATGGLSPPPQRATGSGHPYIRPPPSFPPHLTSKNPQKIQKKERGEEKGSGEALPNSALVIYR